MMAAQTKPWRQVLTVVGIALMVAAIGLLAVSVIREGANARRATATVATITSLIPTVQDTVPDDRVHTALAAMEVDGVNYCALVELPRYGTALPVHDGWDAALTAQFPCRYDGSVYDAPLIIGGSDATGQFDFMKTVGDGDAVYITDMTGGRYAYRVTAVEKTADVSTAALTASPADLVLFARNRFSLDYTVVRCSLATERG